MIKPSDHAIYSQEAGCFVSSTLQRFAEILQDYDPYLELRWIPPNLRSDADRSLPYCIVHSPPGQQPYVVKYFGEDANPEELLARLFAGDTWVHGNAMTRLENLEKAKRAFELKMQMDAAEESADMFHFLMTNRSNNYVKWKDRDTGKIIKLDTDRRRVN